MQRVLRLTKTDGTVVAEPLEQATSFWSRGLGLMGRARLPENGGLLIHSCNGIHMMFMRFPIDALFLDRTDRVKRVYRHLPPWRGVVWLVWGAHKVIELPAGTLDGMDLQVGEQMELRES